MHRRSGGATQSLRRFDCATMNIISAGDNRISLDTRTHQKYNIRWYVQVDEARCLCEVLYLKELISAQ